MAKKEEKKAPAAKKEKEVKPPRVTNRSKIREFLAKKDAFTIADIVGLIGGTNANASTTIGLLLNPEKAGKEGVLPFGYDRAAKTYKRGFVAPPVEPKEKKDKAPAKGKDK